MSRGTAIFLIVLGAILAFAVRAETKGVDIQTVGYILLIAGVGGLVWTLTRTAVANPVADLLTPPEEPPRIQEERVDPGALGELIRRARELAGQARTFLEAEGYTNERIDELAAEFVAKDYGTSRDEFIAWAVSQDHLPRIPPEEEPSPRQATAPQPDELA
jgi:Domain of unknown function (DUF6458)